MELNGYIDHTNLKQNATQADIERLCDEAIRYHFATVAINSCWTAMAAKRLAGTGVGVTTCIGFPLGACSTQAKAAEAAQAVADGTTEIDMVINGGHLVAGDDQYVIDDIAAVVKAAQGHPVKVILECCLLDDEQIVRACEDAVAAGASFVKTSTGFSTGGATVHDVALMTWRSCARPSATAARSRPRAASTPRRRRSPWSRLAPTALAAVPASRSSRGNASRGTGV